MARTLVVLILALQAYDRSGWGSWIDADGDCQNTRAEVLAAESMIPVIYDPTGCRVFAGRWRDPYSGVTGTNPSDFDIDHTVPIRAAYAFGGARWSRALRRAYVNDLDIPDHLVVVTRATNRSKGARTPSQWQPPRAAMCRYGSAWRSIARRWRLAIPRRDLQAIAVMIEACPTGM